MDCSGQNIYCINWIKKIIEFDIKNCEIVQYYNLNAKEISGSVLVDGSIYIIDSYSTSIYKFSCLNKTIKKYSLPGINDSIKTICFDGNKFWLSGQKRKYIFGVKRKITVIV